MFVLADDPIDDSYIRSSTGGKVSASFGEAASAAFHQSMVEAPTHALGSIYTYGEAYMDQTIPKIEEEEWGNSEFYRPGLEYTKDMNREIARLRAFDYDEEQQRSQAINSYKEGIGTAAGKSALFGITLGAQALDPINVGVSIIPFAAGTKMAVAAKEGAKLGTRVAAAAKVGAVEGLLGNLAVEPLVYGSASVRQSQVYGLPDAITNVLMGAPIGAGFGALFKVGGHLATGALDKAAGKYIPNLNEFADMTPYAKQKAFEVSVGQLASNKVPDVEPISAADRARSGKIAERGEALSRLSEELGEERVNSAVDILDTAAKYAPDVKEFWKTLSTKNVDDLAAVDFAIKNGDVDGAIDAMARIIGGEDIDSVRLAKEEIEAARRGEVDSPFATILKEHWEKFGDTTKKTATEDPMVERLKEINETIEALKRQIDEAENVHVAGKVVITNKDRKMLKEMGFSAERINSLTPEEVGVLLKDKYAEEATGEIRRKLNRMEKLRANVEEQLGGPKRATPTDPFEKVKKTAAPERNAEAEIKEPKEIFEDDYATPEAAQRSSGITQEEVDLNEKFGGDVELKDLYDAIERDKAYIEEKRKDKTLNEDEYRAIVNELNIENAKDFVVNDRVPDRGSFIVEAIRCFIP